MAHKLILPDTLVCTLRAVHEDADEWLAEFPRYVVRLESRWHVQVTSLVKHLSFNVVAFAEGADGTPYVLKMSPPGQEFLQELAALKHYSGDGIAQLISSDSEGGAMLLERLRPGVSFWHTEDDELATRTCAELLLQLWRPVDDTTHLRDLRSWTRALPAYVEKYSNGPIPRAFTHSANDLLKEMLQEKTEPVLLHADLHHDNILSATRQPYLAIDPKGIIGTKGYDVASFLINPFGLAQRPDLSEVLERRISIFSEHLGLEPAEIARWGYVHLALSNCWSLEDSGAADSDTFPIAEVLEKHF